MSINTCGSQNFVDHNVFSSRIRYSVFELHERTLLTSGILQEIQAVWQGQSFEIYQCLWDMKALERQLEVCWFDPALCAEFLIECM